MSTEPQGELSKKYGLPTAIAMVVGIVIGSGIFFKAEKILVATGGDLRIGMLAWVIGGVIAIACACAFAVLGTKYEKVGGVMDYAEATVGSEYAYYLGWFLSTIYYPSLTGCLAWVSARYTCVLLGFDIVGGECMTITMLYLVSIFFINAVAPLLAGKLQVSLTIIKLIPILLMGIWGTVVGLGNGMIAENFSTVAVDTSVSNPLFTAVISTAFAYEGWILATSINAELKNAKRNLPLALTFGVAAIALIYILYYIGIAGAVPNAVMMENGEEGAKLAYVALFGDAASQGLFVFVVLSCLGTCNGLMMGCTRGFYAVALRGKGPAPKMLAQLDGYSNMPTNAAATGLLMAGLWAWYFYFGTLKNQLGAFRFDSSEVPIITLYAMYIPIFLCFMKKNKEEPFLRRVLIPTLAIMGCSFIVVAGFISYGVDIFYYFIIYLSVMFLGFMFSKKDEVPEKIG